MIEKNQIDKDIHTKAFEEKLQNEKSSSDNNSPMQLEFNFDKKRLLTKMELFLFTTSPVIDYLILSIMGFVVIWWNS